MSASGLSGGVVSYGLRLTGKTKLVMSQPVSAARGRRWTDTRRLLKDRARCDIGYRSSVLDDITEGPLTDSLVVLMDPRRLGKSVNLLDAAAAFCGRSDVDPRQIFHANPGTGTVDVAARLVPAMVIDDARGQETFRLVLKNAPAADHVGPATLNGFTRQDLRLPNPKDLRSSVVTDLQIGTSPESHGTAPVRGPCAGYRRPLLALRHRSTGQREGGCRMTRE